MKIEDQDYVYCLGKYGKTQCPKCKRNIELYEDAIMQLYWTDTFKLRNSTAKRCPEYKAIK